MKQRRKSGSSVLVKTMFFVATVLVWPSDFDGSAHLAMGDKALALAWPAGTDAHLIDGRLQITFSRRLETPINLAGSTLNASFYESTYFFAFKITKPPELVGEVGECGAKIIPFVADPKNSALQATLAKLSREETPEDRQVGALFADRIALQCA